MARNRNRGSRMGSPPTPGRTGSSRQRKAARRGDPRIWGDMVIGGTGLSSTGALITNFPSWAYVQTFLPSTPQSYTLVAEPSVGVATGATTAPGTAECMVQAVEGNVGIYGASASCSVYGAIGIYVSEQLPNGVTWSVRDPFNSLADASRDDYLFLCGFSLVAPIGNSCTAISSFMIPVSIPGPEILGSGEALVMTVSIGNSASASVSVIPFVRSRIKSVA